MEPFALGALVGLLLALTGAGGGILAVPLLVFALHLGVAEAAPVGLLAVGLAAAMSAALGLRDGIVRYRAAMLMGGLAMALAPLGVVAAQRVPNAPLTIAFAAVLALSAWRMWQRARHALHACARRAARRAAVRARRARRASRVDAPVRAGARVHGHGRGPAQWPAGRGRRLRHRAGAHALHRAVGPQRRGHVAGRDRARVDRRRRRGGMARHASPGPSRCRSRSARWSPRCSRALIAARVAGPRLQQGFAIVSACVARVLLLARGLAGWLADI